MEIGYIRLANILLAAVIITFIIYYCIGMIVTNEQNIQKPGLKNQTNFADSIEKCRSACAVGWASTNTECFLSCVDKIKEVFRDCNGVM